MQEFDFTASSRRAVPLLVQRQLVQLSPTLHRHRHLGLKVLLHSWECHGPLNQFLQIFLRRLRHIQNLLDQLLLELTLHHYDHDIFQQVEHLAHLTELANVDLWRLKRYLPLWLLLKPLLHHLQTLSVTPVGLKVVGVNLVQQLGQNCVQVCQFEACCVQVVEGLDPFEQAGLHGRTVLQWMIHILTKI